MADLVLCSAMAIGSRSAAPPEWLHLLPAGEVRTLDGRGPYRVPDASAVIAASMAGGKLVLDENHATDLAAPKGLPAPAAGWIVQLHGRADGIWGRVEWTAAAQRAETWRGYRGVSPAIMHRKDGTVIGIARASLTNTPNLNGLTALHSQGNVMDLRLKIIELLGLLPSDNDETIVNKIKLLLGHKDLKVVGHSAQAEAQQLALQATSYRHKMAKAGIEITYLDAIHAVKSGELAV